MAKKEKNPPAEEKEVESATEGAEDEVKKKGGGKLKLIIIVVLAMAVGGGGAFAALKLLGGSSAPPPQEVVEAPAAPAPGGDTAAPIADPRTGATAPAAAEAGDSGHGEGGEGVEGEDLGPQNIEFKPFIVNLNDPGRRSFLKLTMSVEAETADLAAEVNTKMPLFRDTILLLLSSLSADDISTLDGKMRLRNQMLNRINTQLTSGKIRNIYFSEFVVQ